MLQCGLVTFQNRKASGHPDNSPGKCSTDSNTLNSTGIFYMSEIKYFLEKASNILQKDKRIIAVCAAGSYITNETDKYSDLDLVIVTDTDIITSSKDMIGIANSLGNPVAAFSGEHVGEKKLLICLFEKPLLHVDLKFVTIKDFNTRVENPIIIWEKEAVISRLYKNTVAKWPIPDFQWIEDRFWVWIHYGASKLGRGEYFEAIDFISSLRGMVIGPLFHLKYNSNPRGVRKMEFILNKEDLSRFKKTIPNYTFDSIKSSIYNLIYIYKELRSLLFDDKVVLLNLAEEVSVLYLDNIKNKQEEEIPGQL